LAIFAAYSNVYHNAFLYDDKTLITDNFFLTSWRSFDTLFVTSTLQGNNLRNIDSFYRPLQILLYLFICQTAGPSTVAFHLLNISLHALNACLLFTLGVKMGFQRSATMLAVLLWALHPVQTEAVTYMSGTADPLCGAFLLPGVLVLAAGFNPPRVMSACFFLALALLSKETAVVFPLLAMGLLFYSSEERWALSTYLKTWPFWLLTGLYYLGRTTVLNFSGMFPNISVEDRIYTFLASLPVYLRFLVWPTDLHRLKGPQSSRTT
jgi:hypothetical protein